MQALMTRGGMIGPSLSLKRSRLVWFGSVKLYNCSGRRPIEAYRTPRSSP